MTKHISFLAGVLVTGGAFWLAIVAHHEHFYEVLLLGLLLILVPLAPHEFFNKRSIVRAYILFIIAGLAMDLVVAQLAFHVWHYSYTALSEWVVLYVWTYPVGGFVMVLGYLALAKQLQISRGVVRPDLVRPIAVAVSVMAILAIYLSISHPENDAWAVLGIFAALSAITAWSTEVHGKASLFGDFKSAPIHTLFALLVVTIVNLLVHEYPNTFVYAWTYTPHVMGLFSGMLFPVPIWAWMMWLFLTIGPVSLWYYVRS